MIYLEYATGVGCPTGGLCKKGLSMQEEEKKKLETQTNIYRLENLALEDNLNAKIELIKANTAKEIEERRKIGTLTNELEKEMLKRQEINIKKEIQNSNDKRERELKDLENKEKQKQKQQTSQ